jgi:hypothetical protein
MSCRIRYKDMDTVHFGREALENALLECVLSRLSPALSRPINLLRQSIVLEILKR